MNPKQSPFNISDAQIKEKFNIDAQFDLYLKLVKLDPRRMAPNQTKEMRQCFYGAVGQLLLLLQEATVLPEKDVHRVFDSLTGQVSEHFTKALLPKN